MINKTVQNILGGNFHELLFNCAYGLPGSPAQVELSNVETAISKVLERYNLPADKWHMAKMSQALQAIFPRLESAWPTFGLKHGQEYRLGPDTFTALVIDGRPPILLDSERCSESTTAYKVADDDMADVNGQKKAEWVVTSIFFVVVSHTGELYKSRAIFNNNKLQFDILLDHTGRTVNDLKSPETVDEPAAA